LSTATFRPDGYDSPDSSIVTGAASIHAALSDDNAGSYVRKWPELPPTYLHMTTSTKPAGSMVKQIRTTLSASSISVNTTKISWWIDSAGWQHGRTTGLVIAGTTPTLYFGPWTVVGDLTQEQIDALKVAIDAEPLLTEARFYEVFLDITFAEQPTTTVTAPTGTSTSSDVSVEWTHTAGTDGGAQAAYEVKVFSVGQYSAEGFSPDTAPAAFATGQVMSGSATATATGLIEAAHRAYVRTAQLVNGTLHWAAWDFESFTVAYSGGGGDPGLSAEVLEVNVAADSDEGRLEIVVDRDPATQAWSYLELERNIDEDVLAGAGEFENGGTSGIAAGWEITQLGTPTAINHDLLTAPSPWNGTYQRFGATLDDGDRVGFVYEDLFPVSPGDVVMFDAMIHAGLPANTGARMVVRWHTDAGEFFSSFMVDFVAIAAWRPYHVEFTAPAGVGSADVAFEIFGSTGAVGVAALMAVDDVYVAVNGLGFHPVGGVPAVVPPADQATFYDYYVAPSTPTRYRARAIRSTGPVVGRWVRALGTQEWAMTSGVWVKSALNPARRVLVKLAQPPEPVWQQRRGVFPVAGSASPMVVTDVRSLRETDFLFQTATESDAVQLLRAFEDRIVAIHLPTTHRVAGAFWSIGDVKEVRLNRYGPLPYRRWQVQATEVAL
jgi:hypothetical protein